MKIREVIKISIPDIERKTQRILHIFVMLNLGILAGMLRNRLDDIPGLIAASIVLVILIVYPFIAFNSSSKLYIWLDEVFHKINMKSLVRRRNPRLAGIVLISLGLPDIFFFYFFFFILRFEDLGLLCMMLGKIFKYLGLYNLY